VEEPYVDQRARWVTCNDARDIRAVRYGPGSHAEHTISRTNPCEIGRRAANDVVYQDPASARVVIVLRHRYPEPTVLGGTQLPTSLADDHPRCDRGPDHGQPQPIHAEHRPL
jgi:hypothetical protein